MEPVLPAHHRIERLGMVLGAAFTMMGDLAATCLLGADRDLCEKLPQKIVYYLRRFLTIAITIVAVITARIPRPSRISKGESNICPPSPFFET